MFHDDQQDYYDPSYKIFTKEGGQPSPGQLKTCQRVLFPLPHTWVAADWELFGDNCKAEMFSMDNIL